MSELLPPLRRRLIEEQRRLRVPMDVVERDYALGHILAALYSRPSLNGMLVFKGGTALKKAYFGDYRFSVDLDFTAPDGPRGDALLSEVTTAGDEALARLLEQGPFEVSTSRLQGKKAHPGGQEAFRIGVKFPWHPMPLCSIKLEITVDEPVLLPIADRPLLHGYQEAVAAELRCYSLEEIAAEKLRTILQAQRRAAEGKWLRDCARDYYDLWRLCVDSQAPMVRPEAVRRILPEKCAVRAVDYVSADDFFPAVVMEGARRQWTTSLAALVRPLPDFDRCVMDLRERLDSFVAG